MFPYLPNVDLPAPPVNEHLVAISGPGGKKGVYSVGEVSITHEGDGTFSACFASLEQAAEGCTSSPGSGCTGYPSGNAFAPGFPLPLQ
ncbi:hypothetical protein D3C76_1345120 [compost metagenome]